MNASTLQPGISIQNDPDAPRILEQFQLARKANRTLVFHAVIAGQMMIEKIAQLHQRFDKKNPCKPEETKLENWLGVNCPDIPMGTAKRWMLAASRVIAHLLKSSLDHPEVLVSVNREPYYISVVLTMPDQDCLPEMLAFRANFQNFLENKTLVEATSATMFGADDDSRITRAANGEKGGANFKSPKDWPLFIGRKFYDVSSHISHWETMDENQRSEIKLLLQNMILGDETKLQGRPGTIKSKAVWPEDLCRSAQEALRKRLSKKGDAE